MYNLIQKLSSTSYDPDALEQVVEYYTSFKNYIEENYYTISKEDLEAFIPDLTNYYNEFLGYGNDYLKVE